VGAQQLMLNGVLELEQPLDRSDVDTTAQFYYINSRKNFSYFRHLMLKWKEPLRLPTHHLATDQNGWA
jgi:hypothetical protein